MVIQPSGVLLRAPTTRTACTRCAAIARAVSATEAASEITTHPGVMNSATSRSRRASEWRPGRPVPDFRIGVTAAVVHALSFADRASAAIS